MLSAVACVASLPQPDARDAIRASARWPGTTVADLRAGRATLVESCAGCHALPLPREHGAARWEGIVRDMADEARLDAGERDRLLRYLVTEAEDR
jgi:hypothetical protein